MSSKKTTVGAVVLEPGNTVRNETGSWRSMRPVVDESKCTGCGICWLYCPDAAISKEKPVRIDYSHCKGCGICANECPAKAIRMVMEEEGK
ncbi:MAG: pyruvate synthase subunit PorD [Candidatus Hadarchaeales archaeon]